MFSWIFELTPDGLKRDAEVTATESIAPQTARRVDRTPRRWRVDGAALLPITSRSGREVRAGAPCGLITTRTRPAGRDGSEERSMAPIVARCPARDHWPMVVRPPATGSSVGACVAPTAYSHSMVPGGFEVMS